MKERGIVFAGLTYTGFVDRVYWKLKKSLLDCEESRNQIRQLVMGALTGSIINSKWGHALKSVIKFKCIRLKSS